MASIAPNVKPLLTNLEQHHGACMVILRRTQRLAAALPLISRPTVASDTALGDWYVNRITVDRRPLLILVSSLSLLPLLLPARDVRQLSDRLADIVARRLGRLQIPSRLVEAEVQAMSPVVVARTDNRS